MAIASLTFGGVLFGYVRTTDHAQWSAYSLSAQSLAGQAVEQVRAARWDPQASPAVDQLGCTNFVRAEQLDAAPSGSPVWATNYISITPVSTDPPLRQLRADCVWSMASRGGKLRGPFTNTVITLRTTDQ